jgi:hypothetical protein
MISLVLAATGAFVYGLQRMCPGAETCGAMVGSVLDDREQALHCLLVSLLIGRANCPKLGTTDLI